MVHGYEVGTRAWQSDATDGWVASEVQSRRVDGDKVTLVFQLDNGEVGLIPRGIDGASDKCMLVDQNSRDHGGGATVGRR